MPTIEIEELCGVLRQRGLLTNVTGVTAGVSMAGVSYDPAPIRPGALYVDLYGDGEVGRRRIREAVAAGATAVACAFACEGELGVPVLEVSHARRALSCAGAALHAFPADALMVVGITGTSGKTTVSCMLGRCLEAAGVCNGVLCSTAIKVGARVASPDFFTTPDAPELQGYLRAMADAGVTHAVLEVSSHGLAHDRVADVSPRIAVVTNLGEDHLDFHPDMRHYEDTKALLFERLRPEDLAIANIDDPGAARIGARTHARRLGVGTAAHADMRLEADRLVVTERAAAVMGRPAGSIALTGPLLVAHNRTNAALAASAAYALGAPAAAVSRALQSYPGGRRRLQCIYRGRFRAYDDLGCNPGHFAAAFAWLEREREAGYKRLLMWTNVRGGRGAAINVHRAALLARHLPALGLARLWVSDCEDDARVETRVTPEERAAFLGGLEEHGLPYRLLRTNAETAVAVARAARRGDLVLIQGGWGMESVAPRFLAAVRALPRWRRGFREWFSPTDPVVLASRIFDVA